MYRIHRSRTEHITLAEAALDRVRHPRARNTKDQFWALRDVGFDLFAGEVVGVIGRNGAGKSTLLKLLTRITAPTEGQIEIWGRIGSLLEVGTGFHPELTGRENIYLNGSILGMSRSEIDRSFESIVEFANVAKFLDTPVKRYSSGMHVRLGFSIAAHLNTELLLLDEVLAVGDSDFQERCFRKVVSLAREGRTILMVSHNLGAIRQFTTRSILLDAGRMVAIGTTGRVISEYLRLQGPTSLDTSESPRLDPNWGRVARITSVGLDRPSNVLQADQDIVLIVTIHSDEGVRGEAISVGLRPIGAEATGTAFSANELELDPGSTQTLRVTLTNPSLAPGAYLLSVAVGSEEGACFDGVPDVLMIQIDLPTADTSPSSHWNPAWGRIRYGPLTVEKMPAMPR